MGFSGPLAAPSIVLRRVQSFELLEKLLRNLPENYPRMYSVDSGLDRFIGRGENNRDSYKFYETNAGAKMTDIRLLAQVSLQ